MRKNKLIIICLSVFMSILTVFVAYAAGNYYSKYHYQTGIACRFRAGGTTYRSYATVIGGDNVNVDLSGSGQFACYLIPRSAGKYACYYLYMVSDKPFQFGHWEDSRTSLSDADVLSKVDERYGKDVWNVFKSTPDSSGYYMDSVTVAYSLNYEITDLEILGQFTDIPFYIVEEVDRLPWTESDFVLGEDPNGGGDSSSIVYDSSIPAPENLKFEERSKSFGFLSGSKFEHCLTWSNGLASPPLNVRISAVADCMYNDTGQSVPDSMLELLSASPTGVKADTGTFVATADDIKSKILDGTTLVSMLEYRVQFYRYDADGKLCVGPVSTVHLNYNKLGKYIGYTVTTDRPKDESNIGQSGGMDDYYQNPVFDS